MKGYNEYFDRFTADAKLQKKALDRIEEAEDRERVWPRAAAIFVSACLLIGMFLTAFHIMGGSDNGGIVPPLGSVSSAPDAEPGTPDVPGSLHRQFVPYEHLPVDIIVYDFWGEVPEDADIDSLRPLLPPIVFDNWDDLDAFLRRPDGSIALQYCHDYSAPLYWSLYDVDFSKYIIVAAYGYERADLHYIEPYVSFSSEGHMGISRRFSTEPYGPFSPILQAEGEYVMRGYFLQVDRKLLDFYGWGPDWYTGNEGVFYAMGFDGYGNLYEDITPEGFEAYNIKLYRNTFPDYSFDLVVQPYRAVRPIGDHIWYATHNKSVGDNTNLHGGTGLPDPYVIYSNFAFFPGPGDLYAGTQIVVEFFNGNYSVSRPFPDSRLTVEPHGPLWNVYDGDTLLAVLTVMSGGVFYDIMYEDGFALLNPPDDE
jgi:hypothetical protein